MKKVKEILHNGQANMAPDLREYAREIIETRIRAQTLAYVAAIMEEEVNALCGSPFERKEEKGLYHRGGSESGSIILSGNRTRIQKPRVRANGKEIPLRTYETLSDSSILGEYIFKMMISGISTRSYNSVIEKYENDLGVSKSTASRQFAIKSREALNELNRREFPDLEFWAILIDGIHIGSDVIVVAMGIDLSGEKHFLGISQGSTENSEVVKDLLASLNKRNIKFSRRIIAVLDGAKALRKGVLQHFGKEHVAIQRCLIHKQRNVTSRLSKKYHKEFKTRVRQAYGFNDYKEAKREFELTIKWLDSINSNAAESMREGLEDILTLHRLEVPPALRKSLYTTNLIESAFSNPRFKMNRVKRWRTDNDMIKRWAGATLLEQEKSFRAINGCSLIQTFLKSYFMIDKEKIIVAETEAA
jgi:putative transposase